MNEETTSPDFINIGVVTLDNKKVLMIRRAKPERGENGAVLEWAFPGGRIWAESPGRGKGSTFCLELSIKETKKKS